MEIYYEKYGKGKDLIFLHGMGLNGTIFNNIIKKLKGYRCFSLDLRGHGNSGNINEVNIDEFLDDIKLIIKKEKIKNPSLIGHSFGSFIALKFAERYGNKIDKIIAINEVHKLNILTIKKFFLVFGLTCFEILRVYKKLRGKKEKRINYSCEKDVTKSDLHGFTLISHMATHYGTKHKKMLMNCTEIMEKTKINLDKIKNKVIIVNGIDDEIIAQGSYRDLDKKLKNSKMIKIKSGHFLPVTNSRDIVKIIKENI
jgi:pimeloyl-ACP methyl ester carboxylesterase